jgi:two-component system OmpR family response regulator
VQKTVLLVDDNSEILEITARYLRSRGLLVYTSDTALGVSALVLRHCPDIIVLDVMMPALGGDALASLLRALPNGHPRGQTRGAPILFYSAMDEEQLLRLVASLPGTAFIAKADGLPALHAAIAARL